MQQSRPQLSFWQIWNMCFGFLGIQFGFALQNANVSRIFQTLGASIEDIPILWIAAPLTGLIVQPIVGYYSDRTWNKWGRRRPYFLIGAIAASLSLFIMPNSPALWFAAGMLWIMDASINISMEPFRAFVGDMLPEKQRARGYAMQSFFIGLGAIIASALPWIMTNWLNISNTAAAGEIPDSVKFSFYFGGVVFLTAVMWTVFKTKEYSPEELASFESKAKTSTEPATEFLPSTTYQKWGWPLIVVGLLAALGVFQLSLEKELYILGFGLLVFGALLIVTGAFSGKTDKEVILFSIVNDLLQMPKTMKQLALVQFFSWFTLFAMWIYTSAAVPQVHFGATDTHGELYNQGANWVGILFAAYNGFAAVAAIFIPMLTEKFGLKATHCINLLLGAAGLASFLVIRDPNWLLLSMVGVGFAWASILSIPYALLANVLPGNKMGVYMGIFNFFIVIPQILAASILGVLVKYLADGQAIYALLIGASSMVLAALLTLKVTTRT